QEASQVSDQINYAVSQTLAQNSASAKRDEYTALVTEPSSVKGLMESTLVTSHTIAYLYLANVSGQIISDPEGRFELAANRYRIGDVPTDRPSLDQLASQSGYVQLSRMVFGPPIYEYHQRIEEKDGPFLAELHIGVSAAMVGKELIQPVLMNLTIGLIAILGAAL